MVEENKQISQWAQDHGINVYHVAQENFAGKGSGIVATDHINQDEIIIEVPTPLIVSLYTIPEDFLTKFCCHVENDQSNSAEGEETSSRRPVRIYKPESVTTHAILAAYLAFHSSSPLSQAAPPHPWSATWPSPMDFWASMPLFWGKLSSVSFCAQCDQSVSKRKQDSHSQHDAMVNGLLPPVVQSMTRAMAAKIEKDWGAVLHAGLTEQSTSEVYGRRKQAVNFDALSAQLGGKSRFTYCWVVVNTRCLHYILPSSQDTKTATAPDFSDPSASMGVSPPMDLQPGSSLTSLTTSVRSENRMFCSPFPDPNDNMALVPFTDLCNHASSTWNSETLEPCPASHTESSYTLRSPKSSVIQVGTEVSTSYGTHPQDFLFSEYGFILPSHKNADDFLELESIAVESLSEEQKTWLEEWGFWGKYSLSPAEHNDSKQSAAEVCFRTQVVAVLVAEAKLQAPSPKDGYQRQQDDGRHGSDDSQPAWVEYLSGTIDLDDPANARLRGEANNVISSWIDEYKGLASKALHLLNEVNPYNGGEEHNRGKEARFLDLFADNLDPILPSPKTSVADPTPSGQLNEETGLREARIGCARRRFNMLVTRWTEIDEICDAALERQDWF